MVSVLGPGVDTTHEHDDLSQSIVRYSVTDGVHSHVHRLHLKVPAVSEAGSTPPDATSHLYVAETTPFESLTNFFVFCEGLYPTGTVLSGIDVSSVSGGVVGQGLPIGTVSVTVGGANAAAESPACQYTMTFRDKQGAPCSVRFFGPRAQIWQPAVRRTLQATPDSDPVDAMTYYLVGGSVIGYAGTPAYPATAIVSHNGQPFAIPLHGVSGLNKRLRREYKLL